MVSSAVASVKVRRPTQNPRRSPIGAGDRRFQRGEGPRLPRVPGGIRGREATTATSHCHRSRRPARSDRQNRCAVDRCRCSPGTAGADPRPVPIDLRHRRVHRQRHCDAPGFLDCAPGIRVPRASVVVTSADGLRSTDVPARDGAQGRALKSQRVSPMVYPDFNLRKDRVVLPVRTQRRPP